MLGALYAILALYRLPSALRFATLVEDLRHAAAIDG